MKKKMHNTGSIYPHFSSAGLEENVLRVEKWELFPGFKSVSAGVMEQGQNIYFGYPKT